MRPEGTRVWRKAARRALRGLATGRRPTHALECQQHRRGSTWHRRHPDAPWACCLLELQRQQVDRMVGRRP